MWRQLAGLVGGLLYWFLLMVLAMIPYGGQEKGWAALAVVSLPGFILVPVTGILILTPDTVGEAAKMRKMKTARILAWLLVGLDTVLVAITIAEARDLLEFGSGVFSLLLLGVLWAVPWAYWHCVVIRMSMKRMP